jgi:hypothetical protein
LNSAEQFSSKERKPVKYMGQTTNPLGKPIIKVETELCGKTLSLEVGRVGFRTSASVIVRYGDTVVLGTAMVGSKPISMDYFPLSIDYEEKCTLPAKSAARVSLNVKADPATTRFLSDAYRPPYTAVVAEGLSARGPRRRDCA